MSTTLFRWPVRVYYEDTDAGGVVYHASYIAFYERARTEMLRQRHFNQQTLLEEQVAFVVRRMTFSQRIVNAEGKVLNEAEVLIACINPHLMKPIALPRSIVAEFKQ